MALHEPQCRHRHSHGPAAWCAARQCRMGLLSSPSPQLTDANARVQGKAAQALLPGSAAAAHSQRCMARRAARAARLPARAAARRAGLQARAARRARAAAQHNKRGGPHHKRRLHRNRQRLARAAAAAARGAAAARDHQRV